MRALTISDWEANGAVNLLLSGSDDFDSLPVAAEVEGEEDEPLGAGGLEDIAHLPQIDELRNLIRSNPAALPELMRVCLFNAFLLFSIFRILLNITLN